MVPVYPDREVVVLLPGQTKIAPMVAVPATLVASPVPVNASTPELIPDVVVAAVTVALLTPLPEGVKVTTKVAVPPGAMEVGALLTTNWALFEMTVTPLAVSKLGLVMV